MKIELEVSSKRIADIMTTTIESGYSRYWCNGVYWQSERADPLPGLWYAEPATYERSDFRIAVHEALEDGGAPSRVYLLDAEAIAKGLAKMATIAPKAFATVIDPEGDADGIDADCFLQAVTLGEIRYG